MTQKNKDIRRAIIRAGLYNYEVAEAMGVSETYFSRLLHSTLSDAKKQEIFKAILKAIQEANINEK
ncbi:hypothetical protein BTI84_08885 [Lactobacillus delbrueckii subsp. bulgaricus]|nr:hypothetical protein [Lactobacillus delbrueckii subsp. bulgaricus]MBT9011391.1 hypothetical protein [Lactobacillus delbrueckii subsp. bulgaricus]MBT9017800.1 hypothetical protein [Lactobacillus delbrueckii subsp. bulgaricus]MBT9076691.1 hypothetical protein [Lactobacillus delbrueckii subsp. bulgaricus]